MFAKMLNAPLRVKRGCSLMQSESNLARSLRNVGLWWCPCPLLKKYYLLSSIMSPNCEGTSKLDGILFFGDSVLNDLSVLNTLFLCFHTFQSCQKKSNLMLTFSRENMARAQCSVFSHAMFKNFWPVWFGNPPPQFTSEEKDWNSSLLSGH